jgi:hypothetical protein
MQLNPGRYGAKRQSWEESNPRDVLERVINDNPRASEREIYDISSRILSDGRYFKAIFEYWFTNNYRSFFHGRLAAPSKTVADRGAARAWIAGSLEKESIKRRIKTAFLDYILSNGRALRDSTFGECKKEGGWLTAISKLGKPNEVVGKVLSEKRVAGLRKQMMVAK